MGTVLRVCLAALLAVSGTVADCPTGYELHNTLCYKVYTTKLSKTDATNKCNSDNGYLTSIQNVFDNGYLATLASNSGVNAFWIGLQCGNGNINSCAWDDGLLFNYNNFLPGNPSAQNGDCVTVATTGFQNGYWQSYPCANQLAFICEVSPGTGPGTTSCLSGYSEFNGNCYRAFPKAQEQVAEAMCENDCGFLTSIHSDAENSYIQTLATTASPTEKYVRIGLVSVQNKTQWLDYSKMDYSHIGFNEPALGSCFGLAIQDDVVQKGHWASLSCDSTLTYICKAPKGACNVQATTSAPAVCTGPSGYTTTLTKNGTINSPGYPNTYQHNRCVYIISSPAGTLVEVQFPVFNLDIYSSIQLYNNYGDATPFKTLTYTSNVVSQVFPSTSNQMEVVFTTGANSPTTGNYRWELVYETAENVPTTNSPQICPSSQVLNTDQYQNGTVYSPGFPSRYQPNSCVYLITSPINTVVEVQFPVIILDVNSRIDIYNDIGDATPFRTIDYTSVINPNDIFSSTENQMKVIFTATQSNQVSQNYRWEMVYETGYNSIATTPKTIINGGCNQGILYAPGTITSPNYPRDYPNNSNCQYQLLSRNTNSKVTITFNEVDVEFFDPITIYNGPTGNYPVLGVLRGKYTTPQIFQASGYQMMVTFTSDSSGTESGFSAKFTDS